MNRMRLLALSTMLILLAPSLATIRSADAQSYPTRPVKMVVPYPPGGPNDVMARILAQKLSEALGNQFYVENQPGAGGSVAAAAVAHALPDGYTVLLGSSSINLTEMILREHPLMDPTKDLVPISMVAITAFGIAVNPAVPVKDLKELIDYIKASPGKMSYGSAGAGTLNHLSGELLKSLTSITDLPHVPYRGAGPALADVIAGQIPMIIPAMTGQVLEFHRASKIRLLAMTNSERLAGAPEIPTAVEAGVPGLVTTQVIGLFVPAGTPKTIVARIGEANHAALADKAYQQSLVDQAFVPVIDWTAEKFNQFMTEDVARWTPLVKAIGVRLD